jgi:TM2 domain-containing membrane protein YozV
MNYEASKESMTVAYILWVCLTGFGPHRFYHGKIGSGSAMLLLLVSGVMLSFTFLGVFLLLPLVILSLVYAFLIPGIVRK